MHEMSHAYHDLSTQKSHQASNELRDLLYDGERFMLEFFSPISCITIILLYHSLLKVGSCVRYIITSWDV